MKRLTVYSISAESLARSRRSIRLGLIILAMILTACGLLFYCLYQIQPSTSTALTLAGLGWLFLAGLMFVCAVALIRRLIRLARMSRLVQLYDKGLDIFQVRGRRSLSYANIKRVELLDDSLQGSRRHLKLSLKNAKNKELAHIQDVIENFDRLGAELRELIGQEPEPGLSFAQEDRRARLRQRLRRGRYQAAVSGLLMLILIGLIAFIFPVFQLDKEVRENGVRTEALVIGHYLDDEAVPRLKYQYSDQAGRRYTNDTFLPEEVWAGLSEGDLLPVTYPPSTPWVGFLPFEEELDLGPYLLALLISALMSAAVCLMYLTGHEVRYLNGKFHWLKRGELVEDRLRLKRVLVGPEGTESQQF